MFFVFSTFLKIAGNCTTKNCGKACLLSRQALIFQRFLVLRYDLSPSRHPSLLPSITARFMHDKKEYCIHIVPPSIINRLTHYSAVFKERFPEIEVLNYLLYYRCPGIGSFIFQYLSQIKYND
jgi:hypothetical protein